MSPDSAPGSNPDELIDLSDIMDDGPGAPGAAGADVGDASFDQELEDLFSDALPDDPGAPAPAAKAKEQAAGDDAGELEDMDFSDLGIEDAASPSAETDEDIIDLTGFDAANDDSGIPDVADDDLIDLSEFTPVEELKTVESGAEEDVLELTELEEVSGEMDVDAIDLTDLAAEAPAAMAGEAVLEEPDLSDLLDDDAPEEHAASASGPAPAMDDTVELELPDIDLEMEADADATLEAPDMSDLVAEAETAAEADLDALAAALGANEQDVADLELDLEDDAAAELAESEEAAPAFAEQALDMAPEEAAPAIGAAVAAGIDLAALDAIIEDAGGPPAEEPAPAAIASAEEFQEARDRIAALEAKTDALADKLDALPGADALEALGEKLTAGFDEMLRREMDALKDGLPGRDASGTDDLTTALSGVKDELLASMSEGLDALRTEIEDKIPAPPVAPDVAALAAEVKEQILPELQAALPDPDGIAGKIEALSERLDALGAEIEKRAATVDLEAAAARIKTELLEDIERSAAAAAAKVLREEIKALAEEEESD